MRIDLGKQAKDEPSLYFEKNNGLLHVAVDTVCRTFTEHSANSLVPVADFTHLTRFAAIEVKAGELYMQGRWTPTMAKTDLSSCIRASVVNRIIPALDHLQNVLNGHSTRSCPVAAHFPIPWIISSSVSMPTVNFFFSLKWPLLFQEYLFLILAPPIALHNVALLHHVISSKLSHSSPYPVPLCYLYLSLRMRVGVRDSARAFMIALVYLGWSFSQKLESETGSLCTVC